MEPPLKRLTNNILLVMRTLFLFTTDMRLKIRIKCLTKFNSDLKKPTEKNPRKEYGKSRQNSQTKILKE